MPQPTLTRQTILAIAFYFASTTNAQGQSFSGRSEDLLSSLPWIILGLTSGLIGSKILRLFFGKAPCPERRLTPSA